MKKQSGFTLLEVVVALSIFALLGVAYLSMTRSAAVKSEFGAKHFDALLLSQKVQEDIIQEFEINPHANETLMLAKKSPKKENIVDQNSIFFLALEDRKPPWGKIDSMSDGGIAKDMPLYNQVKDFKLGAWADREGFGYFAAERANMQKVSIEFDWKTKKRLGSKSKRSFYVFSPSTTKSISDPESGIDYKTLGLEKFMKSFLPSRLDKSKPLETLLRKLKADEKTIFEITTGLLVCRKFWNSDYTKKSLRKINKLIYLHNVKKLGEFDRKKVTFLLAEQYYEMGKTAFQILSLASKYLRNTPENRVAEVLSSMNSIILGVSLNSFNLINKKNIDWLRKARAYYLEIVGPEFTNYVSVKEKRESIGKLVSVFRILSFTSSVEKSNYQEFARALEKETLWRDQFLNRFMQQEAGLSHNEDDLVNKFPNLSVVRNIMHQRTRRAVRIVKKILGKITKSD